MPDRTAIGSMLRTGPMILRLALMREHREKGLPARQPAFAVEINRNAVRNSRAFEEPHLHAGELDDIVVGEAARGGADG
jgi:hypothetical protein